jgi:RNA polymerase sigma factor (sigma-70 family)
VSADWALLKKIIDFNVGWFLRDAATWADLSRLYSWSYYDSRLGSMRQIRRKIPWLVDRRADLWLRAMPKASRPAAHELVLNRHADRLRRIFEYTFVRFLREFRRAGLFRADARWTSFGLSYEALLECTRRGQQENFRYAYRACVNLHRRHLGRLVKASRREEPLAGIDGPMAAPINVDVDFRIDFEGALATLDVRDAAILRGCLLEGRSFRQIGELIGLHESNVRSRLDKAIASMRVVVKDYEPPAREEAPGETEAESGVREAA